MTNKYTLIYQCTFIVYVHQHIAATSVTIFW